MRTDHCDLLCLDVPVAEQIRAAMPDSPAIRQLALVARSCADPTRLSLLLALRATRELCVCDLTWIVGRSQNLVSHHLRALREAGMVETRRDAKIVFYSLTPVGTRAMEALGSVEMPA